MIEIIFVLSVSLCLYIYRLGTCLFGHDLKDNGNVKICSNCKLIVRKIKK